MEPFNCAACTFLNLTGDVCSICMTPRPVEDFSRPAPKPETKDKAEEPVDVNTYDSDPELNAQWGNEDGWDEGDGKDDEEMWNAEEQEPQDEVKEPLKTKPKVGPSGETETDAIEEAPFLVLTVDEVEQRMTAIIAFVSPLNWPRDDAVIALRHHRWNGEALILAVKQKGVAEARTEAGLPPAVADSVFKPSTASCILCDDNERCLALGCGHTFCFDCWRGWVAAEFRKGPRVLQMRCANKCAVVLPPSFIKQFLSSEQQRSLDRWEVEGFVDACRNSFAWCPGRNCNRAFRLGGSAPALGVRCKCGHGCCFSCVQEDHSPATCHEYKVWMEGIQKDAGASDYIVANTKSCPKCKVHIEKNQGCDHMTCSRCKHEFCWLCFADWRTHRGCNRYDQKTSKEGDPESARSRLQRYVFFSDRWRNHLRAVKFATETRARIGNQIGESTDAKLIQDVMNAIEEITQCRQVLAWTYVYAFYVAANDGASQRLLFENHQESLEKYTDKLHELVEKKFLSLRAQELHEQVTRLTALLTKYRSNINMNIKEHPLPTTLQNDDKDTFRHAAASAAALDPKSLSDRKAVMENLKKKPTSASWKPAVMHTRRGGFR